MKQRHLAITTGIALVLMALIAGFSMAYAYPKFYQADSLTLLKNNILAQQGLYKSMLLSIVLILILDLLVSYTLYKYFKNDHRRTSRLAGIIRVIYTIVFGIATYSLIKNLDTHALSNEMIVLNFQQFQFIWNGGLLIFGIHILLIAWLMKLHQKIPKILWILTLIAGVSYIVVHLLKLSSSSSTLVTNLEMVLALPMAAGELGLAIWLWIKGGKETRT